MIYELRIYRCVPGRKLSLLSRFENETLRIWEKHGIRQAGFWTTLIGKSSQEITYMLAWDSMAERERSTPSSRMRSLQSDSTRPASAAGSSSERAARSMVTVSFKCAPSHWLERDELLFGSSARQHCAWSGRC